MYSSTFMFDKKQFDEEFQRLDQVIGQVAKDIPGYLGEEAWENSETGRFSNVYYWETMEALQQLIAHPAHPAHQAAKRAQANWLNGYQVIIAQVLRAYGDGGIAHPTAQFSAAAS